MLPRLFPVVAAAAAILSSCSMNKTAEIRLGTSPVEDVVAAMTREEKVRLLIGTGMEGHSGDSAVVGATRALVPGAAGTTYPIPRLGIPAIVLADGPAGLRIDPVRPGNDSATYYCTHFPIGTLLAATWDTATVRRVGAAIGEEALEYGVDILLAPAINIHRNPLCGRNFEYYSEDPLLAGNTAAAYIDGVQSRGVGTSVKHFAANNQETNRMGNDSRVDERVLQEIYLRPFRIAVQKGRPWTVMSSYNRINGTYASQSERLLTGILRDEWGFDGMVMTDWYGGDDPVAQMRAGNDMLQPGYEAQYEAIMAALVDGTLDEAVVDRNVARVLGTIMKTPRFKGYAHSDRPDLEAHARLARIAAADGMVLLKNDNATLPFRNDIRKIALFGTPSNDFIAGGTGSGNVNRAYTVSLVDGLRRHGFEIDSRLLDLYTAHIGRERASAPVDDSPLAAFLPAKLPAEMRIPAADLADYARTSDAAIVTIGRSSGEFVDRVPSDFELSADERALLESVARAFHAAGKPLVVVLNIGGVIETASWKHLPDAILCAWQGGQEGGDVVAGILNAYYCPGGRLPMTFPVRLADHPSSANFPGIAGPQVESGPCWDYTDYAEGLRVGYRHFNSGHEDRISYPFGHGLAYTRFEYSNPRATREGDTYKVSVTIRNAGDLPGREVVQVYTRYPFQSADPGASTAVPFVPEIELRAYGKTALLKPGLSEELTLTIPADDLTYYDEASGTRVPLPGTPVFHIGASLTDIRTTAAPQ